MVSILIAARNEENNILDCLHAIAKLNYPLDQLEILIGNDQSEDRTKELVEDFIADKPSFALIDITHTVGATYGKANVLAQLALRAKGDYLFITDADVQVPPDWIKGMLKAANSGLGIVTGITIPKGKEAFQQLQMLDWVYALGMVKMVSDWGLPVTAMGNNMMVTREAYRATGGYENLPFSITEDYTLFREIVKRGYKFKNLMNTEVLAYTKPVNSLSEWLHQRKRWMYGAVQLPWYMLSILFLQALFFPCILTLALFQPILALIFWSGKVCIQSLLINRLLKKLNQTSSIQFFVIFELYHTILSFLLVAFYMLPVPVQWKGRKYSRRGNELIR